jgi:hypothetical protein
MADTVSIQVDVRVNTALGDIDTSDCRSDGGDWNIWPRDDQVFEIQVSTDGPNPGSSEGETGKVGDEVGLVQTLVSSKRIATYQGGGQLIIVPEANLPCLDAQEETAPFYDKDGGPQQLPSGQGNIKLKMIDAPSCSVPYSAHHPEDDENAMRPIEELNVEEQFLITLWNKSASTNEKKIIAQWSWGYKYDIMANNVRDVQPQSAPANRKTDSDINEIVIKLIADPEAKVAGAGQVKQWTNGYNHPAVEWAGQGGPGSNQAGGDDQAGDKTAETVEGTEQESTEQEATDENTTEQEQAEAEDTQGETATEEPAEEEHAEEEPAEPAEDAEGGEDDE